MGIALSHQRRLVPQEPLHLVQFDSRLNQSRREGMPQIVEMKILDPGFLERQPKGTAQMPAFDRCSGLALEHKIRNQLKEGQWGCREEIRNPVLVGFGRLLRGQDSCSRKFCLHVLDIRYVSTKNGTRFGN